LAPADGQNGHNGRPILLPALADTPKQRRRIMPNRVQLAAGLAFVGFAVVLTAIESIAVRAQADFGRYELQLSAEWVVAVPVALEAGALTYAGLSLWATLTKDRAPIARVMTLVTVLAAAGASWVGSRAAHRPEIGAAYFAGASIMALLMWHQILHRLRREELRAENSLAERPPNRPRFGLARWLVDFRGTLRAWRLAVLQRISDAEQALAEADAAKLPPLELSTDALVKLAARDRLAVAFGALGRIDIPAALAMLQDRGAPVDQSYAYQLKRTMLAETSRRRDGETS
jgi:hypothetical protein